MFIHGGIRCDRMRVGVDHDSRIGGMDDSRHRADVEVSSHTEGEGSSHVRGGWSGHRCRPVEPTMGRHREAWGRIAPGARIPGEFCITEYVIGVGTQVGYIGSYADVRVVTRTPGDRRVTDERSGLVVHICVRRPGDMFVLLFIFVDVREVVPYRCLRMSLAGRSSVRKSIRRRDHMRR